MIAVGTLLSACGTPDVIVRETTQTAPNNTRTFVYELEKNQVAFYYGVDVNGNVGRYQVVEGPQKIVTTIYRGVFIVIEDDLDDTKKYVCNTYFDHRDDPNRVIDGLYVPKSWGSDPCDKKRDDP